MFSKSEIKSHLGVSLMIAAAFVTFVLFNGFMFGPEEFGGDFLKRFPKGVFRIFFGVAFYVFIASAVVRRRKRSISRV